MNVETYHGRLRAMRLCVVCILLQEGRGCCDELHHAGDPTERNDWAVVPLCDRHHQGVEGIHAMRRRGFVKATKLSDVTLLAMTAKLFAREWGR